MPDSETSINMQIPIDSKYVYPQGMEKMVTYVKNRYNNTPMFITENGKHNLKSRLVEKAYVYFCLNRLFYRIFCVGQPK